MNDVRVPPCGTGRKTLTSGEGSRRTSAAVGVRLLHRLLGSLPYSVYSAGPKTDIRSGWLQGVPSPRKQDEGHGGVKSSSAAVRDSSAYGARNVHIVTGGN